MSLVFLTMALALGVTGLLLHASMENNKASLYKIEELQRNNVAVKKESTVQIPQPQEIAQPQKMQEQPSINMNAPVIPDAAPNLENQTLETLPDAEELID